MINTIGDGTRAWLKFQKDWKKNNPPLDNGCYLCGICGSWVLGDEVVLDHIIPRSNDPSGVLDENNIQPAHYICNSVKGSRKVKPVVGKVVYDFLKELSNMKL